MSKKYSDKIESNKRRIIYNKNIFDLNNDNNHFLNGENLELPTFQKNNYQNQFIHRKLLISNSKKNKNKYIYNYPNNNNEENKLKETNFYSDNNNVIPKNIENYLNDSLTENFENMKQMNTNINNILSNMKKEIETSNKVNEEEIQKREEDLDFDKFSNKLYKMKNINDDLDNFNIKYDLDNSEKNNQINQMIINDIKNNINIQETNLIIDKNEQNRFNIKGIKKKKFEFDIEINEFKQEHINKLNSIYGNNNVINIEKLIDDLYEYKNKYEKLNQINEEKVKSENEKELIKLKEENTKLNLQNKFLINELTKSIYNGENFRNKYKNELDRFDSYINKMKYEIKENNIDS